MATLKYDDTGRLLFTKEMKEEYTLLMPQMLPVHFGMFQKCLQLEGYKVDMLTSDHDGIIETGLRYVHNDTCYPALLVIGQLIDAIESGVYDKNKVALMITQTGGGCRASNYIYLLRKALQKAGLSQVPVVSVNFSGLEKNPGFTINLRLTMRMIYSIFYGDTLTWLGNQCLPYEVNKGETKTLIEEWKNKLIKQFDQQKALSRKFFRKNLELIVNDFANIKVEGDKRPPVGIVGEIYVKYSPLGNNRLEEFLISEGAEPVVPGLADFMVFMIDNVITDIDLYGGKKHTKLLTTLGKKYFIGFQQDMINAISVHSKFRVMETFTHLKEGVRGFVGYGNKMGEGWLLTAEMVDLINMGVNNIVCAQPFGCLPNHVAGKGMIRKLKEAFPESNIVAIDYDAGATKINQENRIKLMLANAKKIEK